MLVSLKGRKELNDNIPGHECKLLSTKTVMSRKIILRDRHIHIHMHIWRNMAISKQRLKQIVTKPALHKNITFLLFLFFFFLKTSNVSTASTAFLTCCALVFLLCIIILILATRLGCSRDKRIPLYTK